MDKRIAANIQSEMTMVGYGEHDMAQACGVSVRTWERWIADPGVIQIQYLDVIAKKLRVKMSKLLEGREE